uniref:Solute carrier family 19 member 1 n=1 Tax=Papio anubis TaxID=9555 RepID=A0A096NIA7_PAPAN
MQKGTHKASSRRWGSGGGLRGDWGWKERGGEGWQGARPRDPHFRARRPRMLTPAGVRARGAVWVRWRPQGQGRSTRGLVTRAGRGRRRGWERAVGGRCRRWEDARGEARAAAPRHARGPALKARSVGRTRPPRSRAPAAPPCGRCSPGVRVRGAGSREPQAAAPPSRRHSVTVVPSGAACDLSSMVPSSPAVEKQVPVEPGPDPELRSWRRLVCYLCFYGFMAQIRPGESFITPYLLGPDKNFTPQEVTNKITPVLSYSYLAVLVPVFLLTDYLRYTPVLLLQGLSFVSVWLLLLLGRSVAHMQLMEFFYSVTMAARIAYSSYIFSLVRPARYQRVAGYSRAAVLLGVFTSSVLGQLLVTVGRVSFSTLNYISLAFLTFSVVLALFLKRPKRSLFFNRDDRERCEASASELERMNAGPGGKLGRALRAACGDSVLARMLRELRDSLRRPQLRLWSLWWVFNSAGYYLVVYYVHILWNEVDPTTNSARVYNGAADAASTLLGAITPFHKPEDPWRGSLVRCSSACHGPRGRLVSPLAPRRSDPQQWPAVPQGSTRFLVAPSPREFQKGGEPGGRFRITPSHESPIFSPQGLLAPIVPGAGSFRPATWN